MRKINVYCAWYRSTIVKLKPKIIDDFVFEIPCLECKGTGIWNFYTKDLLEEFCENNQCIDCKGIGKQYVGL